MLWRHSLLEAKFVYLLDHPWFSQNIQMLTREKTERSKLIQTTGSFSFVTRTNASEKTARIKAIMQRNLIFWKRGRGDLFFRIKKCFPKNYLLSNSLFRSWKKTFCLKEKKKKIFFYRFGNKIFYVSILF